MIQKLKKKKNLNFFKCINQKCTVEKRKVFNKLDQNGLGIDGKILNEFDPDLHFT